MSQGERKLLDERGRFAMAVVEGRSRNQLSWRKGRVVLSNRRLIVADANGKKMIPLSAISKVGGRADVNQQVAAIPEYLSIHVDEDVLLVETSDTMNFEQQLYEALLNGTGVKIKHPSIKGGVVQNVDWVKGRVKLEPEAVAIALASGSLVDIDLTEVASVETEQRGSGGDASIVVNVDHVDADVSVITAITGSMDRLRLLVSFIRNRSERNDVTLDLEQREHEVLMGLYSGVSPFELPEFVGIEAEELEAIFDRLIEADVVEEIRVRREVALTTRGRNIASEAMSEQ